MNTPSKFTTSNNEVSPTRSSVSGTLAAQPIAAPDSQTEVVQLLREDAFKFLCTNQSQQYVYEAPAPSQRVSESGGESKFVKFFSGTWAGGGDFSAAEKDNHNDEDLSYSSVGSGKQKPQLLSLNETPPPLAGPHLTTNTLK